MAASVSDPVNPFSVRHLANEVTPGLVYGWMRSGVSFRLS